MALIGFIGYNAAQMGYWKDLPLLASVASKQMLQYEKESDCEKADKVKEEDELNTLLGPSKTRHGENAE